MALTPPPSLQEATRRSTTSWQQDLQSLFFHAKDRFPDVVWDVVADVDNGVASEEVWGHKGELAPTLYAHVESSRPCTIVC